VGCPTCGGLFATKTKFFDHCKRQVPLESKLQTYSLSLFVTNTQVRFKIEFQHCRAGVYLSIKFQIV
jgi:hypothetical protein